MILSIKKKENCPRNSPNMKVIYFATAKDVMLFKRLPFRWYSGKPPKSSEITFSSAGITRVWRVQSRCWENSDWTRPLKTAWPLSKCVRLCLHVRPISVLPRWRLSYGRFEITKPQRDCALLSAWMDRSTKTTHSESSVQYQCVLFVALNDNHIHIQWYLHSTIMYFEEYHGMMWYQCMVNVTYPQFLFFLFLLSCSDYSSSLLYGWKCISEMLLKHKIQLAHQCCY